MRGFLKFLSWHPTSLCWATLVSFSPLVSCKNNAHTHIFAGYPRETGAYKDFLFEQAKRFQKVFVVVGNFECHHSSIHAVNKQIKRICAQKENLIFLNRKSFVIGDVRICGCTLWTKIPPEAESILSLCSLDYKNIFASREAKAERLRVRHTNNLHDADVLWLKQQIREAEELKQKVLVRM